MNPYNCPNCGSHNTQSFDNIHSQNVRYSYDGTNGNRESWNQLALQTAPPQNPHVGCGSIVLISFLSIFVAVVTAIVLSHALDLVPGLIDPKSAGSVVFLEFFFAGGITFIAGLIFTSRKMQKQIPNYRQRVANWNRSMLCRRCGHAWLR